VFTTVAGLGGFLLLDRSTASRHLRHREPFLRLFTHIVCRHLAKLRPEDVPLWDLERVRPLRRYVREARRRLGVSLAQVFIPLDPELGVEAEVDLGTCYAIVAGECTKLKAFCMRSKGSGKPFV
jgi:hypothetical protein